VRGTGYADNLGLIAFSTVLLMTPAAYHRIVEQGEETEHLHRFASLLAAMALLALGICGDLFVVRKVSESTTAGIASAILLLAGCYRLWFGYMAYLRSRHNVVG